MYVCRWKVEPTLELCAAAFSFASWNLVWNFFTSTKMLETRIPAFPIPTLTLPRGCFDIRNSRAARFDLSTTLRMVQLLIKTNKIDDIYIQLELEVINIYYNY